MDENDVRIVKVTNITNFDFTPEMGAMYGGRAFAIPVGKYLLAPFTIGDHLATHMARQILLRKAPTRDDPNELDGRGKNLPLWSEEAITDLKKRIISDAYVEEKPQVYSQDEALARRIAELNASPTPTGSPVDVGGNAAIDPTLIPSDPKDAGSEDPKVPEVPYRTKADVITELTVRNVKFDARATKAELEKLLGEPAEQSQSAPKA